MNTLKLSAILGILTLASCSKSVNERCNAPQDLGIIELSDSAAMYLDYDRYDEVEMITSNGLEMRLWIENVTEEIDQIAVEMSELPCQENTEEKILSVYKREKIRFDLIGDQVFRKTIGIVGIQVIIEKQIEPNQLSHSDVIAFFPLVTSSNERGYALGDNALFSMKPLDSLKLTPPYKTHEVLKFKTRWYDAVHEGPWSKEGLKVFVRKGLGIVAISSQGAEQVYLKALH